MLHIRRKVNQKAKGGYYFMDLYIVLAIMAFMVVGFLLNKWPFGLTTMTCCVLLALTGVFSISEAFAGFANKTLVLLVGMFGMVSAFQKTSVVDKIQAQMLRLKGKSGMALVIGLYVVVIALACFMPTTANMVVMLMFLVALGDSGEVTPTRMTIPLLAMIAIWGSKLPLGMGAASHLNLNARYEGMLPEGSEGMLLDLATRFKVMIVPCIILTIYCLIAWKWLPNKAFDASKLEGKNGKKKEKTALPQWQENLILGLFLVVMVSLLFGSKIGDYMYLVPVTCLLIITFSGCMSVKETVSAITIDSVWMIAGVLVVADALGKSGAGDVLGNAILKLLGGNPSGILVMFVFAIVTIVMTTFMSNSATSNVLIPVAASVAIAAGWDPRGLVLIVSFCSGCAIAFPSGSPACGIAYASTGYKLSETFKFTIPFIILAVVSIVFSANFFCPIYG